MQEGRDAPTEGDSGGLLPETSGPDLTDEIHRIEKTILLEDGILPIREKVPPKHAQTFEKGSDEIKRKPNEYYYLVFLHKSI